jgi:hypothetical protein
LRSLDRGFPFGFPTAATRSLLLLLLARCCNQLVKPPKVDRVRLAEVLADSFDGRRRSHLDDFHHIGTVLDAV